MKSVRLEYVTRGARVENQNVRVWKSLVQEYWTGSARVL